MVSAGREQGRSHATVAGGKLMELRLMVSIVRGWSREGAMPRLLELRLMELRLMVSAGMEPCHGCWR